VNQISSALGTDTGRRRPHNEDYIAFFEPNDPRELQSSGNIYIVADGVGGAEKGERASRFAVQKVLYEYYQYPGTNLRDRLRNAMRQAGNEIFQFAAENAGLTRMATTMVAAVIHDQMLTVANVGDSRAYLIRNGRIEQITRDHSIVGEMVRNGLMTEEEASHSTVKNKITRSLGGEVDVRVDVFKGIPLHQNDMIILCSDGLTRYASSQDLLEMASQNSPPEAVEQMIEFANTAGGADNISIILIEVGKPLNADQPTLPLPRGQAPEPVDWDTMQTKPSIKVRGKKPKIPKEYLLIAFGLLVVVVVCGMMFIMFRLNVSQTPPITTPTLNPSLTSTSEAASTDPDTLETETLTVESARSDIAPAAAIEGSSTISQAQTISETQKYSENISSERGYCVYEVKSDDATGLGVVLSEFGLQYERTNQYFYFDYCVIDPPYCSEKIELLPPHNINIGSWMLIETVNQGECTPISDGFWITDTE